LFLFCVFELSCFRDEQVSFSSNELENRLAFINFRSLLTIVERTLMRIEEKFSVKSPIQKIWDSLLNPEIVGLCIPGCEKVEPISDTEYDSIIKAKVGFMAVRFKVRTVIEEIIPNQLIRTVGEGKELRNLGQFKQKTRINFNALSEDETEISYQSDVSIVGKLATFGDRILKAKAKEVGKEFADAVIKKLE